MKMTKPLATCFTYTIGKNLYVPFTSRSNAKTLPESRGPNFFLDAEVVAALCRVRDEEHRSQRWAPWCVYLDTQMTKQKLPPAMPLVSELPAEAEGDRLPSVEDLAKEILEACRRRPDYTSIVIAGEGEPTLRLDDVIYLAATLKAPDVQMLPPLRLTTNGLVQSPETVVEQLKDAGIQSLSVALMTADRTQYDDLMTPLIPNGHEKVCNFIDVAIKAGLDVETTAVDRPDVDKKKAEDLARDLNVGDSIRWRPFFP